jgi:hypothetical protein
MNLIEVEIARMATQEFRAWQHGLGKLAGASKTTSLPCSFSNGGPSINVAELTKGERDTLLLNTCQELISI